MYIYILISFVISIFLNIIFIPFFKSIKVRQAVRVLGPREHYKKNGTPTMGGIVIIATSLITFILALFINKSFDYKVLILIFPFLFYGFIGFIDDYLKVIKRNNDGIKPKTKFLLQFIFSILFIIIFYKHLDPIVNIFGYQINFGIFYYLFIILLFLSMTNACNLSDGLDGLAGGEAFIILASVLYICNELNVSLFIISLLGAVLGFLCFNVNPAKIFMGDVGSLSIGASICSIFIVLKIEILLLVFCLAMAFEVLSVIIQVIYFKITKGKRLFKMAPFHHHLELSGLTEIEVTLIFWGLTLIFSLFGILFYIYFF